MFRGTPFGQYGGIGGMPQPGMGYGSQQPMVSNMAYRGPQQQQPMVSNMAYRGPQQQQPMVSNTRYTGPQQGSPNALTFARGPIPLNQQGPAVGGSLARGLGQIPLQQQQMGSVGQNLFNMLRGQPATQQPALTPAVMPQQPVSPQLQAVFQAASNQMAGRPDNYANFGRGVGNDPTQPKFLGKNFTGDAPPPGMKYIETSEGLVPVPINDMPQQPMVSRMPPVDPNVPYRPTRPDVFNPDGTPGTRLQDPDFNINTAMNTFNQRLGDYVKSGRMSVADAQRAQAEMRALQLNPAGATRQQATEIAQRNLQVGQYSPANVAAQQAAQQRAMQQPMLSNLADRFRNAEGVVGPYTSAPRQLTQEEAAGITSMRPAPPPPDRQVIGFMTPPPGVRSGDTRVFADQPVTPPPPPIPTPPPTPTPAPTPGMPQGWNVSSAYRDFGGKLAQMIKSGQLTPQQANAIKDPAFQATKLGNTPEAFAAMQKALAGLTGYAAGGYATQVAPEDPRMQAMRYLQRLGE